jgi:hypothetical protein
MEKSKLGKQQYDTKKAKIEAEYLPDEKSLELEKTAAEVALSKAKVARSERMIELGGIDPATGKPYTKAQRDAANYALRIGESLKIIDSLGVKFKPSSLRAVILNPKKFNAIKDPKMRRYSQAIRTFINSTLRRESGATINENEFDSAYAQYSALLRDDPETLHQKENARYQVLAGLKAEAGTAYDRALEEYNKIIGQREQTTFDNLWKEYGSQ